MDRIKQLIALAASLVTALQALLSLLGRSTICLSEGCHIVENLTRISPLYLNLAGFTQLDSSLPQVEPCGGAGISGPTSAIFHRMPLAILRVPVRCLCPLLP